MVGHAVRLTPGLGATDGKDSFVGREEESKSRGNGRHKTFVNMQAPWASTVVSLEESLHRGRVGVVCLTMMKRRAEAHLGGKAQMSLMQPLQSEERSNERQYLAEAQGSSGRHNQTRQQSEQEEVKRVLRSTALERSIDNAKQTKSSLAQDNWEDNREKLCPSTRQANEDRENCGCGQGRTVSLWPRLWHHIASCKKK